MKTFDKACYTLISMLNDYLVFKSITEETLISNLRLFTNEMEKGLQFKKNVSAGHVKPIPNSPA